MARLTKNVKAKPPALRLVDLPCQVLLQVSSHLDGSNVGRFETSSAAISGVLRDAGAGPAVWDLLFRLTDATSPATRRAVDAVNGGGRQTALRRAKLMFLDPRSQDHERRVKALRPEERHPKGNTSILSRPTISKRLSTHV